MKNLNTALGPVEILDAQIVRSSGYGQYTIVVEIEFEGERKTLNQHSTDSQLFDKVQDADDKFETLLSEAKYTIEGTVEDYINSL